MGVVGPQQLLGAARLERLKRTPQGWQLTLDDGRQLNAPLLVAADGANSALRRLAEEGARADAERNADFEKAVEAAANGAAKGGAAEGEGGDD